MIATIERIRSEVRQLSYDERETLVRALELDLDSTTPEDDLPAKIESAWDAEIDSRVAEIEAGNTTLLTRDAFGSAFAEARQKLKTRQ